jgi:hypothetical protein
MGAMRQFEAPGTPLDGLLLAPWQVVQAMPGAP